MCEFQTVKISGKRKWPILEKENIDFLNRIRKKAETELLNSQPGSLYSKLYSDLNHSSF